MYTAKVNKREFHITDEKGQKAIDGNAFEADIVEFKREDFILLLRTVHLLPKWFQ